MKYQWHIFLASLNPAKGSEQSGRRPVLVIEKQADDPLPSGGGMNAVPTAFEIKAKPISS